MTDERKPPKPRRIATNPHKPGDGAHGGRAALARDMPRVVVLPPVAATLDDISSLVKLGVDRLRTEVEGGELSRSQADALHKMAQTLASVQASKKVAKQDAEEDTDKLTERELQVRMVDALDLQDSVVRERVLARLRVVGE